LGNIVERGVFGAEILGGQWDVVSIAGTGVQFKYDGQASIQSLSDLDFSVTLLNSLTVPEPTTFTLLTLGSLTLVRVRRSR
jgi:hypothetical protein